MIWTQEINDIVWDIEMKYGLNHRFTKRMTPKELQDYYNFLLYLEAYTPEDDATPKTTE